MMDVKKMGNDMMDFYKTTFDQSFDAMMMVQDQMARLTNLYWGQMLAIPEEAKKGMTEWTKSHKKNCEDFKKMVDNGFKNLESLTS